MTDLKNFCQQIQHAKDKKGHVEKAECKAVQIDEKNGLAVELGFKDRAVSKVDYCEVIGNTI
ncbi:MAG: hypothetical protein DRQ51_05585 [Gammaproteobacteria bacterium]|nr:MAG: hypothetical protein DRQ51_05585 [Gammaproteobacteria bacterium]